MRSLLILALWLVLSSGCADHKVTIPALPREVAIVENAEHPEWSPDGKSLAFIWHVQEGGLAIKALSGGEPVILAPSTGDVYPQWSPDGRRIAYCNETGLFVVGLAGEEPILLAPSPVDDVRWSPDGSTLACVAGRDSRWHIFLVDPDSGQETALTGGSAQERYPEWSWDGKMLAFWSDRELPSGTIYVLTLDPRNIVRLVGGEGNSGARWSGRPYSYEIAFLHRDFGNNNIYALAATAAGNQPRQLTTTHDASDIQWSPEGSRITFIARYGDGSLWVVPAAGGVPVKVPVRGRAHDPRWSPDGQSIAYSAYEEGRGNFVSVCYLE